MLSKVSIEKVFVIFALFFGLLFLFITPPFQSVDEANHFFRAYGITQGQIVSLKNNSDVGSFLPASLTKLNNRFQYLEKDITKKTSMTEIIDSAKIKDNKSIFTTYPNTALYSPIGYIAQSTGIIFAKLLGLSPIFAFYFARIMNLLLYCILGYYAIKCTPFLKLAVFLILLSPMNLSLGASCSTDAILTGTSLLIFSKILQYTFQDKPVKSKDIIILSLMFIVLALTKHNFYLVPLIFLIPKDKFGENYLLKITAIILPSIILCAYWSYLISGLYVPLNNEADMYKQIEFIIHNPFKFILTIILTTIIKSARIFITSIGVLGWQDTKLDNLIYMIYPILIGFSIYYNSAKDFAFNNYQKILTVSTVILSYIIITTYLYLAWTKVGGSIVIGLNGKYYTPLIFPTLTLIALSIKNKNTNIRIDQYTYIFTALILLSTSISLMTRFYAF